VLRVVQSALVLLSGNAAVIGKKIPPADIMREIKFVTSDENNNDENSRLRLISLSN